VAKLLGLDQPPIFHRNQPQTPRKVAASLVRYGTDERPEWSYTIVMAADTPDRSVEVASSLPLKGGSRRAAPAGHSPHQNHLLDALPARDYERLAPHLELIPMGLGDVLYESGSQLRYVYFPTTAIISLLYVMEDGASAEIAIVGNEGILGISLFMGGETTPSRAVVQSTGHAFRLKAELLKNEFGRSGPTMHLLLRYTQALITQTAQTAACNRHHSVDQQLCRWLLLSLDRLASNELSMTQELIANMLGVRREGVTEAAGKLQDSGLIHYRRGQITVLDRPGLEARSCECYQVVKTEFDRLLPYVVR
jgi:CRP-like cAMP-binding protein